VLTVNIYEELLHSFLLGEVQSHVISTWTTSATVWKVGGTNITEHTLRKLRLVVKDIITAVFFTVKSDVVTNC
jgi:hypothetical protein